MARRSTGDTQLEIPMAAFDRTNNLIYRLIVCEGGYANDAHDLRIWHFVSTHSARRRTWHRIRKYKRSPPPPLDQLCQTIIRHNRQICRLYGHSAEEVENYPLWITALDSIKFEVAMPVDNNTIT